MACLILVIFSSCQLLELLQCPLKVSYIQNEFMRSSFLSNANQKLQRFLPYPLVNFQGRNLCNFRLAFWKKRWPHEFILNLTELYHGGEGNDQLVSQTIWQKKVALQYDFCYIHNSLKFEPKNSSKCLVNFILLCQGLPTTSDRLMVKVIIKSSVIHFSLSPFFITVLAVVSNFMLFHSEGYILILSYFTRKAIF